MSTPTEDPHQAIYEFYALKREYERAYRDKHIEPLLKQRTSRRDRKRQFQQLPPPECINCRRPVGTVFSVSTADLVRRFSAKCGDVQTPCPLDVRITLGLRTPYDRDLREGYQNIERYKRRIIQEKNNLLFFPEQEAGRAEAVFEELSEDLKAETSTTGFIAEHYLLTNENPERAAQLRTKRDDFSLGCVAPLKQWMQEYAGTGNEALVQRAAELYQDTMVPLLRDIQALRFDQSMVDVHEEERGMESFELVQQLVSAPHTQFYFTADDKVQAWVLGVTNNTDQDQGQRPGHRRRRTVRRPTHRASALGQGQGQGQTRRVRPATASSSPLSASSSPPSATAAATSSTDSALARR